MDRTVMALLFAVALVLAGLTGVRLAACDDACGCKDKASADKAAPMINTYKCSKTEKTWTQPASEKKACPFCGAAAPDCGALVKSEPASKTVWTCRLHKFVCEDKAGKCKMCNMKLIEVPASSVPKQKASKIGKGGLVDVSKEAQECERGEE